MSDMMLSLAALMAFACAASPGVPPMDDDFYDESLAKAVKLDVEAAVIRDAAPAIPTTMPAPPTAEAAACRYVNPALNSRLDDSFPAGSWDIRWKAALDEHVYAGLLLAAEGKILVQGSGHWQMFGEDGRPVAKGPLGFSDIFLDPQHQEFYLQEPSGRLGVRRLANGELTYTVNARLGDNFARPLIARKDRAMIVVGIERPIESAQRDIPEFSSVELLGLGDPPVIDEYRSLTSMRRTATLIRHSTLLLPALCDDTLVLSTHRFVYFLDSNLKIRGAVTGDFTPIAMSLDEACRVYLIVRVADDYHLWVLTREGERLMDHAQLPLVERGAYRPPIIGYDHRVYILGDGLIQAIGPDGKLVWEQRTSQRPAGAAITLDGQLLVTEGNTVFAYSRRGEPTRLYSAGRQELTTAPVLTRKRGLLVASGREFYCLEAKPVERH